MKYLGSISDPLDYVNKKYVDTHAVPVSRTINGKALSSNVTLVAADIDAVTNLSGTAVLGENPPETAITPTQVASAIENGSTITLSCQVDEDVYVTFTSFLNLDTIDCVAGFGLYSENNEDKYVILLGNLTTDEWNYSSAGFVHSVTVNSDYSSSGTQIGRITVDGHTTTLYAPSGGGGGGGSYSSYYPIQIDNNVIKLMYNTGENTAYPVTKIYHTTVSGTDPILGTYTISGFKLQYDDSTSSGGWDFYPDARGMNSIVQLILAQIPTQASDIGALSTVTLDMTMDTTDTKQLNISLSTS